MDSDAPESTGARKVRHSAEATAPLPAAGAVARAHSRVNGWSRPRKILAIGSVVVGMGLIAFGLFSPGGGDVTALANGPVTTYADRTDDKVPAGEYGVVDRTGAPTSPATDEPSTDEAKTDETKPTPDSESPTTPHSDDPGTTTPGTTTPTDPGTPTTPTAPTVPTTPTTPPPVTPKSLTFAGVQKEKSPLGLITSYTLSVTGNPGSKALVKYGTLEAGTITFDSDGNGSIGVGGALLGLNLFNPMIRVSYSDGTAGSAIEARRDDI
ncbi:MAG: hypothetical protein JF592_07340 [Microbacterium sp.]|uniref:hypothetical protein n=1 Tax=Microbacterium sp. TaxID=51671 RepID=UPI001D593CA9|nr:hypothetical protein [Microbacterium sp.]MBW8762385.1 hypothetical protein [Microbacterium sp.]